MHRFRPLFLLVALVFTAYSALVVVEHGYIGFLTVSLREPAAMQMLVDLGLALVLVSSWMVVDARRRNRAAWPSDRMPRCSTSAASRRPSSSSSSPSRCSTTSGSGARSDDPCCS